MAQAAIPLLAIGTAVSAFGVIYQAQSVRAAEKSAALIAQQNAQTAREKAALEQARHRRSVVRHMGAMRAAMGASGLTPEGTPTDVLLDSTFESELDNMLIRYGGELEARGFESDAALALGRARSANTAGYLNAASTALSGGYQISAMKRT